MMTAVASSEEVGIDDGIDNRVIKSGIETNKKKRAVFYGRIGDGWLSMCASRSNSAFRIKAVCFPRVDFPNQLRKLPMILVTAAPVQICTEQFPSTPAWFWKLRNQIKVKIKKKF